MERIYLDHNATTPPAAEVVDRMAGALREQFGNPSSVHHFGQVAKSALDEARSATAALVGGDPSEIAFTSGGTESDNFAIRGVAEALEVTGRGGSEHAEGSRPARLENDASAGRPKRDRGARGA